MNPDHILCHYAEIGLKGKNRKFFEDRLKENIKAGLKWRCPGSYASVKRVHGRILIHLTGKGQQSLEEVCHVLKETFGIAYFALAYRSRQEMESLMADSLRVLSSLSFESFRITARRGEKSIPLTSREVNEAVGAHVVENLHKSVNLSKPDVTCYIDLFQKVAFVYTERFSGPGGLPVGSSGKVVAMLSGGIDSPVAAFYGMKRGTQVIFLHFHSVPYTTRASIEKVREVVQVLRKFQPQVKLILAELAPVQKEIMLNTPAKFRVILYRRFMVRIAEAVTLREGAHAVVTGESLGQVASQTLENMKVIEQVTAIPVLRPLVGFDKQEIVDLAGDIGTYEISIQPDQDCCSVFVPKHPATRARLEDVVEAEQSLDVTGLVKGTLETMVVEVFD